MLQRDEGFSLVNPPEGCSFHLNFGQLWLWKFLSLSTGNGRSLDNQIDRWLMLGEMVPTILLLQGQYFTRFCML